MYNSIKKAIPRVLIMLLLGLPLISCNGEIDPIAQWHDDPNNRYYIIEGVEQALEIWNLSKEEIIDILGEPAWDFGCNIYAVYVDCGRDDCGGFMTYFVSDDSGTRRRPKEGLYSILFTRDGHVKRTFTRRDASDFGDTDHYSPRSNDPESFR